MKVQCQVKIGKQSWLRQHRALLISLVSVGGYILFVQAIRGWASIVAFRRHPDHYPIAALAPEGLQVSVARSRNGTGIPK